MIISCPSCHTRYRHRESSSGGGGQARCSRCDEVFDVEFTARPYRVQPTDGGGGAAGPGLVGTAGATGRLSIGMDEPGLASKLGRTALDSGAAAMTYRVQVQDKGAPSAARADSGDSPAAGRPGRRWLRTGLLVVLGSVIGWAVAGGLGRSPWALVAIGALLGLLLAKLGVPWNRKPN